MRKSVRALRALAPSGPIEANTNMACPRDTPALLQMRARALRQFSKSVSGNNLPPPAAAVARSPAEMPGSLTPLKETDPLEEHLGPGTESPSRRSDGNRDGSDVAHGKALMGDTVRVHARMWHAHSMP